MVIKMLRNYKTEEKVEGLHEAVFKLPTENVTAASTCILEWVPSGGSAISGFAPHSITGFDTIILQRKDDIIILQRDCWLRFLNFVTMNMT